MNATTVAVDFAKSEFQLAVADEHWRIVETQTPITLPAACLPLVTIGASVTQIPCRHGPQQSTP